MKCSTLLAAALVAISSPLARGECGDRVKTVGYGSHATQALDKTDSDGGFTAPNSGDFLCKVTCDAGSNINVYVKYSTSGTASSSNYDAKLEGGSCGDEISSQNYNGEQGIKIRTQADAGYQNLVLTCDCRNVAGGGGCFSGDTTVSVEGRGITSMKDLQVGDKVLTNHQYEPVYSFGHYHENLVADFVELTTEKESYITLTGNHLLYANGNTNPIRADRVQVGDQLSTGTVKKVATVTKQGLYMPLTPSGKIEVNNVEASAYISMADYAPIQNHPLLSFWLSENFLVHLWLAPYRVYCMGVSSNHCPNHVKNVDGDSGIMGYLLAGKQIAEFALEHNLLVQLLIGVPIFVSLLAFHAVETVSGGPAVAPLAVLFALGLYMKLRRQKQKAI
ncbi:Warthog protein [Seminavis robusta]|uniref:Warthog protein n=1 Tax=Seminavis robusta TaxID=568900 RepID=A0A9N8F217_9STRA|nr:Warthog protein [Seminavis robusta]|eukprot:Sro2634_g333250.1 Warthog protein (391) ;mRNA; f:2480-3740